MSRKWLPKAPAGMPGVWHSMNGMLPMRSGAYYPNNLLSIKTTPALVSPGTTLRAWCARLPSDSLVGYVGTTTKLYTYDGNATFSDKSRGGGYTNTATNWSFAQFGNITLAGNKLDAMQSRDASGAGSFADLAGAPKASILVTQAQQVLAFDIDDGTDRKDAFATCAPGDYTDWSGAGATTATHIRHRPGKITAAVAFRDYVLAFKQSSVYKLTYTGSGTYKWRVECIAIGRGAWAMHDVVNCGDVVIFSGPGGVWSFDGAAFRTLTEFFGDLTQSATSAWYSPYTQNVFFHTTSTGAYVYNLESDRWGAWYGGFNINSSIAFMGESATLAAFVGSTTDLFFSVDLNLATGSVRRANTAWGAGTISENAYLVGGVEGIGGNTITAFSRLTPDFTLSINTTAIPGDTELLLDVFGGDSKDAPGLNISSGTPVVSSKASSTAQRRFDFLVNRPYARFYIKIPDTAGYCEIMDYQLNMAPAGTL